MKESDFYRILVINPGSTSTKVALFKNEEPELEANIEHPPDDLKAFEEIWDQFDYRRKAILDFLERNEIPVEGLNAVVGRGGLLKSVEGGTYEVNEPMLEDARANLQGVHISNTGCALAEDIAREAGVKAYVVDPVSVDEFNELAYYSGIKEITRKSLAHTLSIHGVVRNVCTELGREIEGSSFVVAHMGGGISVCPVKNGRILDANNANSGGPFSPQRSGELPVQELMGLCFSGAYTHTDLMKLTLKQGGLTSYLGTDDAREVEERISGGDKRAEEVYRAMAYQIAKEIGAMATVLEGKIDAVILTGGLAGSEMLMNWIKSGISFIGNVLVIPEVSEMYALAAGALRVLGGEEKAKEY